MTHDELLAEIGYNAERTSNALRAVVKLHKPIQISGEELCDACEEWTNEGARYRFYPCPTVQAIEEQMK